MALEVVVQVRVSADAVQDHVECIASIALSRTPEVCVVTLAVVDPITVVATCRERRETECVRTVAIEIPTGPGFKF